MNDENPMRKIRIEKLVLNMGVGQTGEELNNAQLILEKITERKTIQTKCKVRAPTWGIREGLTIGAKVTLRKDKAVEVLKRALSAKDNSLSHKNFDNNGNFGFGIKEYIDLPGVKYDAKLGIRGFDVLVSLERKGYRLKRRKERQKKVGKKHRVTKEEAIEFIKKEFGVEVS
ncbi:MAG: 50S ribosomal protein L5 [archaeon]